MVPTLYRIELLHPITVHFAVALLTLGAVAEIARPLTNSFRWRSQLSTLSFVVLSGGCVAAWVAYWTGEMAEDVVNRVICDPTVTQVHAWWGWITSLVFTAVVVARALALRRARASLSLIAWCLSLAGLFALVRTAHLGASLVFTQGAAVYRPSEECTEFE